MTVEDLIIYGKKYISSSKAKMLLANILNYDTLELFLHLDQAVTSSDFELYKKHIQCVLDNYPVQYLVGKVNFYGYDFKINDKVLIPRFDTEQLVFRVLEFIKEKFQKPIKIIDLGCGSGIIGITLAKEFSTASVTCLDIDDDAISLTKENAKQLGADIRTIKGDMLSNIDETFDVIVSNPPYISINEEIEDIVKNNEPHLALYAGKDGLDCYRKILGDISKNLNKEFLIAFEIGYTQAEEIKHIAYNNLPNIEIKVFKDLSDKDRVVLIYNKCE